MQHQATNKAPPIAQVVSLSQMPMMHIGSLTTLNGIQVNPGGDNTNALNATIASLTAQNQNQYTTNNNNNNNNGFVHQQQQQQPQQQNIYI